MNILSLALAGATTLLVGAAGGNTQSIDNKESVAPVATVTETQEEVQEDARSIMERVAREKLLARWQKRQAHLWKKLPKERFTINASAYTAAADECGKSDGITASGEPVRAQHTLACPPEYPFGARIAIEGMGTYTCTDRGGAIKGNHFDIYMPTKREAFAFGRRNLSARVVFD